MALSPITTKIICQQWYNMAHRRSKQPPIRTAWTKLLIALSIKVPECRWPGCNGNRIHDGSIDSFNISGQKWNLLLDAARDESLSYLMTYDAVSMYANEDLKLGVVLEILQQQL